MLKGEPRCLVDRRATVTESPLWDAASGTLYFVDIEGCAIVAVDWASGATRDIPTGRRVACLGLAGPGRLIAGLEDAIVFVDVATGAQQVLAAIEHPRSGMRLNDGRVSPDGRFWVGSMKEAFDEACGRLYRYDASDGLSVHSEGLLCSNGLAFSVDGRTMYHADSRRSTVWHYAYDPATGTATDRRTFAVSVDGTGRPDGAAVDTDDGYWIARFAGARVMRHAPDGTELFTLPLPVDNPTMCAFAGPDLSTLVVTSARGALSGDDLARQPLAGSVLAIDLDGVRGLPTPQFDSSSLRLAPKESP